MGDHVSFYPGGIVGHDSVIEDYVIVAPGAVISGFVHVERGSYLGAHSVIRQHLRVGTQALVGMGAVVVRDVAAEEQVVGNPARPLASRSRLPSGTESRPADGTYREPAANGVQA